MKYLKKYETATNIFKSNLCSLFRNSDGRLELIQYVNNNLLLDDCIIYIAYSLNQLPDVLELVREEPIYDIDRKIVKMDGVSATPIDFMYSASGFGDDMGSKHGSIRLSEVDLWIKPWNYYHPILVSRFGKELTEIVDTAETIGEIVNRLVALKKKIKKTIPKINIGARFGL